MTKHLRPPQSYAYYNAAYVAYAEGNNKQGDYLYLLYVSHRDFERAFPIRQKTKRQQEQTELFRQLGFLSREIANLRTILNWQHIDPLTKTAIRNCIYLLTAEYKEANRLMKTISQRIPPDDFHDYNEYPPEYSESPSTTNSTPTSFP